MASEKWERHATPEEVDSVARALEAQLQLGVNNIAGHPFMWLLSVSINSSRQDTVCL